MPKSDEFMESNGFKKSETQIWKCRNEFIFIHFNLFSFTGNRFAGLNLPFTFYKFHGQ